MLNRINLRRNKQLKNVFIHFGAHKTGTSYLQYVLGHNSRLFRKRNSTFLHPRYDTSPAVRAVKKWQRSGYETPAPKKVVSYLNSFISLGKESVFISSESLFGTMNLASSKTIYPFSRNMMAFIKNSFEQQQVKVAFSIRNYADFIESSYKWKVQDGLTLTFEEYVEQIDLEKLSWVRVIEDLLQIYGKENVLLWSYEDYKLHPNDIHLNMLRFFYGNVGDKELKIPPNKSVNVSPNSHVIHTSQELNKAIANLPFLNGKQRREARVLLKPLLDFVDKTDTERPVLLDMSTRQMLDQRYAHDTVQIEKIYGKSLANV